MGAPVRLRRVGRGRVVVFTLASRRKKASANPVSAVTSKETHLSESFDFDCAFFLFGAGILHSMENATQLVHGTPRLAASQRTCVAMHQHHRRRSRLRAPQQRGRAGCASR